MAKLKVWAEEEEKLASLINELLQSKLENILNYCITFTHFMYIHVYVCVQRICVSFLHLFT